MGHFAVVNKDNIVVRVLVVGNEIFTDENGVEQETLGIEYVRKCFPEFPSNFKILQTSINTINNRHYTNNVFDNTNGIRKNCAGPGYIYDEAKDAFIAPSPYPSWVFNEETFAYEAPLPIIEDDNDYIWDESVGNWVIYTPE
jgi:hypothetical protein